MSQQGVFQDLLGCHVLRVEYDYRECHGVVFMAQHNCVDMAGAVELFTTIDPDVVTISTFAGPVLDTQYRRVCGQWGART